MANAWFTDGGRLAIVCQPTSNAEIYFSGIGIGNGGTMPMDLADSTNYNTPSPMSDIGQVQTGNNILICKFKTYPYPPHNPQYEYEVRCYFVCESATYDSAGNLTEIWAHTVTELYNVTLDTSVYSYQSSRIMQTIWPDSTATAVITNPFIYAYFGNDDARGSNMACGIGAAIFKRNKADGAWLNNPIGVGQGSYISREWMRSTIGVDINPEPSEPDPDEPDPNEDGDGYSGPGGGDGDHDHNSDDIGIPSLPTLSATATGFVTMYKANLAQIQAVAAEMWTSTIWDALKGLFTDPMDYVVSVDISPVTPELSQGLYYPVVGNVLGVDVKLSTAMNIVTNQYVEVDCGTINLSKYYGSALDFSPYEKVQIHLPYIGTKDLDIDEVMGHDIGVKYHCDVMSGACVAFVTINGKNIGQTVRYEFTGNIISHIPITARSFDEVIKSVASLGATAAISAISAGAASGGQIADREGDAQVQGSEAAGTMTVKPNIQRAGALSTQLGYLGVQIPYITRTIPRQSLPENYSTYEGYPSNITETLGSLSGFTKVFSIRPNGFTCTSEELDELITLLKGGVIL